VERERVDVIDEESKVAAINVNMRTFAIVMAMQKQWEDG
jgi:hypothetical protein